MQQEMFKLYREHRVNPLGGCWPMLLPMPVLFALFFVFQNAIELRGTSFLWIPDLSRPDPLYIIPVVMGASMYVLTKVGQMGMEPNPQMKMMLYMMPLMMTGMFLFFPSGLNLYYTVSNIASIPQQWLLGRERMKRAARAIVDVKTERPAPPRTAPAKKRKKA
jgi:YidC/Oxa1 family membrane protein insertase